MKRIFFIWCFVTLGCVIVLAQQDATMKLMTDAYRKFWNPEVQQRIDRDIEKFCKVDVVLKTAGIPAGTEVGIVQISHHFMFGGNIFLFGDLGAPEKTNVTRMLSAHCLALQLSHFTGGHSNRSRENPL